MTDELRFEKWNKWLDTIYSDIETLLINRYIFQRVEEIIRNNSSIQTDDTFYQWMGRVYSTTQVMGIRRQLDRDCNAISFARLFAEIQETPEILSRVRHRKLFAGNSLPEDYVREAFDRFSAPGMTSIDPALVAKDLKDLQQKANNIHRFADKQIAHLERGQFTGLPTYGELDKCLDCVEELLKKYLSLFRAQSYVHIVPVLQFDWTEIFEHRWKL